jgi:Nucleotidyltransferase of unknown function (DUF6036)
MRALADAVSIRRFIDALGKRSRGPGAIFLTGGATAVLYGWRGTTVDIDIKMDPEPQGAFAAIASIKDELDVNVELAAPDQFVPALSGWRDRSLFISKSGDVDFFHYDPFGQALAKIERGHSRDLGDVRAMLDRGLVDRARLEEYFEEMLLTLDRYPAVDKEAFRLKIKEFLSEPKGS